MMEKPRLTYFDAARSRGEEVRLALDLAGVAFEDVRVERTSFAALKAALPFPHLPVLEVQGEGVFAQTNAILRLIGRLHGLYPEDPFQAARHDAVMEAVEDLRHRISPTTRMTDPVQRKAARTALAREAIPHWARGIEYFIGQGPFVGGDRAGVADLKLFVIGRWLGSGVLDDIPPDILDAFPAVMAVVAGVAGLPVVAARYGQVA